MFYRQRVQSDHRETLALAFVLHIVVVPEEFPQKTFILDPTFCLLF